MNAVDAGGLLLGPLHIATSVIVTWAIIGLLVGFSLVASLHLRDTPGRIQTALESMIALMETAIGEVLPDQTRAVLPFVGTLWLFVVVANLAGLVPGVPSPTSDLSVTAGLAFLVFCSVHWFGIRHVGWKAYFRHYLSPSPILLPFHVISELTRTLALAVRLFGNMMSLGLAALMILLVAGFLVPVPILMLHVVEALVQAYIFGMLALVYIAGAVQAHEERATSIAPHPKES